MWNYPPIILASASQRRVDLLTQLKIPHIVYVSNINEDIDVADPKERVQILSEKKALSVQESFAKSVLNNIPSPNIIIAADTIVAIPSKQHALSHTIFEKPQSSEEALHMLTSLSNRMHEVYTGLTVLYKNEKTTTFDKTDVYFTEISQDVLEQYLSTHEWEGVAGGYRIQGIAAAFIERIEGNHATIMGLPIHILNRILYKYRIV